MAQFNPITDLMPMDSSEKSVDKSSEQIESIRIQLTQTRDSLSNVVNIIKVKNSLLERDLDKIENLNERLKRTIPRIPIMRGMAGVQFGDLTEEKKKRSGLNIPMLPPPPPKTTEVTYKRPGLKAAADAIGNFVNVALVLSYVGSLKSIFRPKVQAPVPANNIVPVTPGVLTPKKEKLIERILSFLKTKKLARTSKKSGYAAFSKDANKLKLKNNVIPVRFAPDFTKREVERYVSQLQRATTGKTKFKFGSPTPDFRKIEILHASNRADLKIMLKQREKQLKTLTPGTQAYKDMEKSIRLVENGIKRINNSFKKYYDQVKKKANERIKREFDKPRKKIDKSLKKEFIYSDFFNKQGKNIKKEFQENIDKGKKILENIFNNDLKVEARPMNDDIAMLNTDTGVTNTVIFITNPPTV